MIAKRILCAFGLAVLINVPLFASIVAIGTNENAQVFGAAGGFVALTSGGATTIFFSGSGRHAISFSAECAVAGNSISSWGGIQIIVDGAVRSPTGSDDAFCTDWNGNNSLDQFVVAHYRVYTTVLAAGIHSVRVQATPNFANSIRLDDVAILVEK
jgi:hypothetical protein